MKKSSGSLIYRLITRVESFLPQWMLTHNGKIRRIISEAVVMEKFVLTSQKAAQSRRQKIILQQMVAPKDKRITEDLR